MIVAIRIKDRKVQFFSSVQEGCTVLKTQTQREALRVRNIRLALTGQRSHAYGYVWINQGSGQLSLPLDDLIAHHYKPNGKPVVAVSVKGDRKVYPSIEAARKEVKGNWARIKRAAEQNRVYKGQQWSMAC